MAQIYPSRGDAEANDVKHQKTYLHLLLAKVVSPSIHFRSTSFHPEVTLIWEVTPFSCPK